MNQYIGQITVIIEAFSPDEAQNRLCDLAVQLDNNEPDIVFADHNGDVEDNREVETECRQSVESNGLPTRFDDYEIAPCQQFEGHFEPCEPDAADVWTLYGHIPGQGVEAIGDFATREDAEEIYSRITGRSYHQQPKENHDVSDT